MTETEVYPGDLVIVENSSAWGIEPKAEVVEVIEKHPGVYALQITLKGKTAKEIMFFPRNCFRKQ